MPLPITLGNISARAYGFASKLKALVDPFFDYVTLLLNGDVINGTKTFITDASTNNFQITPNGQPGNSVQNPFQAGYYSNYFNGSSGLTTSSGASAFGTGDFTFECWLNFSSIPSSGNNYEIFVAGTSNGAEILYRGGSNQIEIGQSGVGPKLAYVWTPTVGTWYHFAVVRSSGTGYIFINGVQGSTGSLSGVNFATGSTGIGFYSPSPQSYFNGYISNLRSVIGTAVYTSNFTPSTTPLTAISGTSLLTCQSAQFIDTSTNNFAISITGAPTVSQNQPFTYTTPVTYGSGKFDGTSSYLTTPNSSALAFGTGDFTFNVWLYPLSWSNTTTFIVTGGVNAFQLYSTGSGGINLSCANVATVFVSSSLPQTNAWTYLTVSRVSGTTTMYFNGVSVGSASDSHNYGGLPYTICGVSAGYYFNGYMSNFQFVVGSGISSVTVPSLPSTPITNTALLTLQANVPAQNNTFLDSSTNNFTITRNGNTTQGSFSPYGNLWSLGGCSSSSDYLQMGSNAGLQLGSGDFTVECWALFTTVGTVNGGENVIMDVRPTSTTGNYFSFGLQNQVIQWDNGSGYNVITSSTIPLFTWVHIAFVRYGGTLKLYINGTQSGSSYSDSVNYSCGSTNRIANLSYFSSGNRQFNGNISNLRIVKGTAVYTSSFTPPTAPLTAISGTTLLTCQSNRWIDNSSNAIPISVNGLPQVLRTSPFNPTAPYSTTTIGGSGYFDGSNGLTITSGVSGNFPLGSAFTCEAWYYVSSTTGFCTIFVVGGSSVDWNSSTGISYYLALYNGNTYWQWNSGGGTYQIVGNLVYNQWNHVAVGYSGGTTRMWVNGVSQGTSGFGYHITSYNAIGIGAAQNGSSNIFNSGYIDDVRFIAGTDIYGVGNSTITVPTAPLTAVSGTSLLTNMTNAGIPDLAMINDLQTVGSAQVSTSVKKYGTGSLAFNGSGSGLQPENQQIFTFGTGAFTIEFWLYLNTSSQSCAVYDSRPTSTSGYYPTIRLNSGVIYFYTNGSNQITGPTLSASTWYHVAVSRSSSTTYLFVNGVSAGTYSDANNYLNGTNRPLIGADGYDNFSGSNYLNGYIDDLRITNGYARYISNFTPPTSALPTY